MFICTVFISYGLLVLSKLYFLYIDTRLINFWSIHDVQDFNIIDYLWASIIVYFLYNFLKDRYFFDAKVKKFEKNLWDIQNYFPYIKDQILFKEYIEKSFSEYLSLSYCTILDSKNFDELKKYFEKEIWSRDFFLNEDIFLEENKSRFSLKKMKSELEPQYHMYFPLYSWDSVFWFFTVGKKIFQNPYFIKEISMLILFSHRISSHYKYFETYKKLQQLSISLDKRVDEKTIQYNELIVKQKEYIGFISHEVRTPITNAIFLSDSLKEDLQQISISHTILEDSNLLNKELIKVSDIIKHVFSSEQFDVNKVKMYKKYIDVAKLLLEEISLFQARFPDVLFQLDIASTAKQKIDEIQFRQVIQNLITNAIKFSSWNTRKVFIQLCISNNTLSITIHDNGSGLKATDIENIFERYATWSGNASGLWLGLYLCKKIIELHGGKIVAKNSKILSGACFEIVL